MKQNQNPAQRIPAKDVSERPVSGFHLIRRFWPYQRKYSKTVALDLFCAALTCLCDLVLPLILRTHPKTGDPMIIVDGDAYVTATQRPPWPDELTD